MLHTGTDYHYQVLDEPLGEEAAITFSFRGSAEAHIGFFESSDGESTGSSAQYEISLCGSQGARSAIRDGKGTSNLVSFDNLPGDCSDTDFKSYWASAANGLVRIGHGNLVGRNVFLEWQDPDETLRITHAAVTTGYDFEGDWVLCVPEICAG